MSRQAVSKVILLWLVLFFLMIALKVTKIHFQSNFLENYVFETEKTNGKWKGTKYHSVVCRSSVVAIQHWQARNNHVGKCFMCDGRSVQTDATTFNNMQHGKQTDATCNIEQWGELLANNVASICAGSCLTFKVVLQIRTWTCYHVINNNNNNNNNNSNNKIGWY